MQGARNDDQYIKWAVLGDNGRGKTGFILEQLQIAYNPAVHKILFLVQTNPKVLKGVTRLKTYDELKRFESGIAMFWDYTTGAEQMIANIAAILNEGQENYKLHPRKTELHYLHNGVIIFDDCSNYLSSNPPKIIMEFMGNYRMFFLDLIFVAHTLTDFPSKLRRRMNLVTVFKTLEPLEENDLKRLNYPNHVNLYKAWTQVMNDPNYYAKQTIRTGT